jgi:hypothetical protein
MYLVKKKEKQLKGSSDKRLTRKDKRLSEEPKW